MIKYRIRKIECGLTSERQLRYMPVVLRMQEIGLERLSHHISYATSFTEADVYGVLRALVSEMQEQLLSGNTIRLGSIGLFSLTVTSPLGERPEEITPHRISVRRIMYRPDPVLKRALSRVEFELDEDKYSWKSE